MAFNEHIAWRLIDRGVRFYHAENLQDFRTYSAERALLCREELMRLDPSGYTVFGSDAQDLARGVLGRVFGNLYDFGGIFRRGRNAVPNIYGPIALVFRPGAYLRMNDLCITPRSIVSLKDPWREGALATAEQLDQLLAGRPDGEPIASGWEYSELSCANDRLPFEDLEEVIVEPIRVAGEWLPDLVRIELEPLGLSGKVVERDYQGADGRPENLAALQALVESCEAFQASAPEGGRTMSGADLPAIFQELESPKRHRLVSWCRYFTHGTLMPLLAEQSIGSAARRGPLARPARRPLPGEAPGPALPVGHPTVAPARFLIRRR